MWKLKLTITCYCIFKTKEHVQLKKILKISQTPHGIRNLWKFCAHNMHCTHFVCDTYLGQDYIT